MYDDDDLRDQVRQLAEGLAQEKADKEALRQELDALKASRTGPAATNVAALSDEEISQRADAAREKAWKETGSQEAAQLAFIRAKEELSGPIGEAG